MGTKVCKKCGVEKKLKDFVKNKLCKNGIAGICKTCKNMSIDHVYMRNYRKENKERIDKKIKEWKENNSYRDHELKMKWYFLNKDKFGYVVSHNNRQSEYRNNMTDYYICFERSNFVKKP